MEIFCKLLIEVLFSLGYIEPHMDIHMGCYHHTNGMFQKHTALNVLPVRCYSVSIHPWY